MQHTQMFYFCLLTKGGKGECSSKTVFKDQHKKLSKKAKSKLLPLTGKKHKESSSFKKRNSKLRFLYLQKTPKILLLDGEKHAEGMRGWRQIQALAGCATGKKKKQAGVSFRANEHSGKGSG